MEKRLYELRTSDALENVMPPLHEMELQLLKDSVLSEGCRDPLVVWNGTIVDGHNRYRICHENNVPFTYVEMEFDDESAAKLWIIRNQLARRNVPDFVRCELVLPLEAELKAEAEKRMLAGRKNENPVENLPQGKRKTREVLAEFAGVSSRSFDKAKKVINSADEETKNQLRRGEISIHKAYTNLRQAEKEAARKTTADSQPQPAETPEDAPDSGSHEPATAPEDDEGDEEPSGFAEIKEQLDFAFKNFRSDYKYALDWLSQETATAGNEKAILQMIDDAMTEAKNALMKKLEELR